MRMSPRLQWYLALVVVALLLPFIGLFALGVSGFAQFDGTCVNLTAEAYPCTLREFAENQLFFATFFGLVPAFFLSVLCAVLTSIAYGLGLLVYELGRRAREQQMVADM